MQTKPLCLNTPAGLAWPISKSVTAVDGVAAVTGNLWHRHAGDCVVVGGVGCLGGMYDQDSTSLTEWHVYGCWLDRVWFVSISANMSSPVAIVQQPTQAP